MPRKPFASCGKFDPRSGKDPTYVGLRRDEECLKILKEATNTVVSVSVHRQAYTKLHSIHTHVVVFCMHLCKARLARTAQVPEDTPPVVGASDYRARA